MVCGAISESFPAIDRKASVARRRWEGRASKPSPPFRGPCVLGLDEAETQAKAKGIISQGEMKRFAKRL